MSISMYFRASVGKHKAGVKKSIVATYARENKRKDKLLNARVLPFTPFLALASQLLAFASRSPLFFRKTLEEREACCRLRLNYITNFRIFWFSCMKPLNCFSSLNGWLSTTGYPQHLATPGWRERLSERKCSHKILNNGAGVETSTGPVPVISIP